MFTKKNVSGFVKALVCLASLMFFHSALSFTKGIYLTYWTAQSTAKVQDLIKQAKASGINTFVIDVEQPKKAYAKNIALIKQNGIRYVARVVMFPQGGTVQQIKSQQYWAMRWRQAQYAVSLGANEIQMDYIRYKQSQKPSDQNAEDVDNVIKYFRQKLQNTGVGLQIDVFGIASFKPSVYIGQNLPLFAQSVDVICPMVYPSHFEPFPEKSKHPYDTIYTSLSSLKKHLGDSKVKIYAFIELSNYRMPMSNSQRINYINAELKAVKDTGIDGWYFWSANNRYQLLFDMIKNKSIKYDS